MPADLEPYAQTLENHADHAQMLWGCVLDQQFAARDRRQADETAYLHKVGANGPLTAPQLWLSFNPQYI